MTSKKKQTVGYRYFLGLHMIGCHGPIDKLLQFIADDKVAWAGESTGGTITVTAENLFGGEDKEGGVSGQIDFEQGLPTQGQNSYLLSKLSPSLVPSFRGLAGFIFKQTYIGTQTYIKKFAFRCSRIHTRENGIPQWYDATSEISFTDELGQQIGPTSSGWSYLQVPLSDTNDYSASDFDYSSWELGQTPFANKPGHPYSSGGGFPPVENTHWDLNTKIWVRKKFRVSNLNGFSLSVFVDNFATVWVNDVLVLPRAGTDENAGASSGAFMHEIIVPGGVLHSGDNNIVLLAEDDLQNGPTAFTYVAFKITSQEQTQLDMNPAHIIRECLTNPDWGMGYTDADIDDVSFRYAADTLYAEAMGISILWNQQTEIEEFVKLIIRHIDAALFVDRHTGKFNLRLIRADYDISTLIVLDESNIEKLDDFTRPQFGELTNSVTAKYWDAFNNIDATTTIQDTALAQMQGVTINVTNEYPGFTNRNIAARVAQRDMKTLSSAIASCTIYANRDASVLNIADVFKLSWLDYNLNQLVMRVTGIDYGDGKSNQVRIQCTEDVFGLPSTALVSSPVPEWQDPNTYPTAATQRLPYEVPYLEALQQYGQTAVDAAIALDSNIGYVGAAVGKPKQNYLNANLYVDSGAGYQNEATLDFCPTAKLVSAIDKMATTFDLANPLDIALAVDGSWLQIDDEIMVKVSYVEPTLTVKRGALDTVPETHAANAVLFFWDNYASNDDNQYVSGESLNLKIATVTGLGELPLSNAPVDTVDIVGRMARPYPPGNFKINDTYFPTSVGSSLNLKWAHRDRKTQTGGIYLGFTDDSVGPEAGTSYNVRIFNDSDDTILYENKNFVGTSLDPVVLASASIRIELESERNLLTSYQKHTHILPIDNSGIDYGSEGLDVANGAAKWAIKIGAFVYAIKDAILRKQNATTLASIAFDPISYSLMALVSDGTNLFTVDIGNPSGAVFGKLRKYSGDLSTHTEVQFPLLGDGFGATFVAGSVWVSLPYSGKVRRYDPATLAVITDIAVSFEVDKMTNDGTYVYVVDRISPKAYKIDPATNTVVLTFTLAERPIADIDIAVSNGLLFISGTSKVMAYDVTTGSANTSIPTFSADVVNSFENLVAFISYQTVIVLDIADNFNRVGLFTVSQPSGASTFPKLTLLDEGLIIVDDSSSIDYYHYDNSEPGGGTTDPDFDSVVLLIKAQGADESTTIIDQSNSAHAITRGGSIQIDTDITIFDLPTIKFFGGPTDFLSILDHPDFNFGSGDWTIEFILRPIASYAWWILGKGDAATAAGSSYSIYNSGAWDAYIGGAAASNTSISYMENHSYYWAWKREGGTISNYKGEIGVDTLTTLVHSQTISGSINSTSSPLKIGQYASGGFPGNVSCIRITKGLARDTSTVPTAQFPTS